MQARNRWQVHLLSMLLLLAFTAIPIIAQEQETMQKNDDATKTEEPLRLEELRVIESPYRGTPADFPGTFNVIPQEEIERLHPSHAGEVIQRVPGITYVDEDGRGFKPDIGIRGLNPTRSRNVLILVDGIPIQPSLYGDPAAYYNVPIQRLERIEVIKGGSAILYGANTVGGVINYITKRPATKPLELSIRESFGTHNSFTSETSAGGTAGRLGYLASYLRKQGDGFRDRLDFELNDGGLRLEGDLRDRSGLTFNFNYHDEDEGTAGGLTPAQFRQNFRQNSTPNDRFEAIRLSSDLTYTRDFGRYGAIKGTLFGNFFERNWFIAGTSTTSNNQFRRKFDVFGAEPQYTLDYSLLGLEHNVLTAGARVYLDRMTDRAVRGSSARARTGTTSENAELGTTAYALYAQNEFALTDRLKLTSGARLEFIRLSRDDFVRSTSGDSVNNEVIPALGASYRIAEKTFVFASFQRSFKPPEFREAIDPRTGTDQDLQAQRGNNYEIGVRSAPVDWFSAETSLFLLDFENQIISEAGRLVNAQDTRHQGIEGTVSFGITRFLRGSLGLALPDWAGELGVYYSLTLLDTEFRRGPFKGNRLPFAPGEQHYWSVRHSHPSGFSTSLDGRFVGDQFPDSANTQVENATGTLGLIPSYVVWDLNLEYRWKPWGSAFFSVKNLLDEHYFTFRGNLAGAPGIFPAPDRTYLGGIAVRF